MDAEDFKTCLISMGYNLVKPWALVKHENIIMCDYSATFYFNVTNNVIVYLLCFVFFIYCG